MTFSPFEGRLSAPSHFFGVVSGGTYQQAITRLSSLSYSQSKTYFDLRRCRPPAVCLTTVQAPDAGYTLDALVFARGESRGWIWDETSRTNFETRRPVKLLERSFSGLSASPLFQILFFEPIG